MWLPLSLRMRHLVGSVLSWIFGRLELTSRSISLSLGRLRRVESLLSKLPLARPVACPLVRAGVATFDRVVTMTFGGCDVWPFRFFRHSDSRLPWADVLLFVEDGEPGDLRRDWAQAETMWCKRCGCREVARFRNSGGETMQPVEKQPETCKARPRTCLPIPITLAGGPLAGVPARSLQRVPACQAQAQAQLGTPEFWLESNEILGAAGLEVSDLPNIIGPFQGWEEVGQQHFQHAQQPAQPPQCSDIPARSLDGSRAGGRHCQDRAHA